MDAEQAVVSQHDEAVPCCCSPLFAKSRIGLRKHAEKKCAVTCRPENCKMRGACTWSPLARATLPAKHFLLLGSI